ncbi:MAG: ATP-binding protein [Candidatus Competibacteraceae bacterium]|jgi:signal transduction histidine kinase|nr:ATP-binding protein [Candidatus Competibacteraceae bacterium]
MNLRQKLLTVFGGLALLAIVLAGITFWLAWHWQTAQEQLNSHYQRSLLLQNVRAEAFRAFKEVADAVTDGDLDARQEFEALLKPLERDFAQWTELAHNQEERRQVAAVRAVYGQLLDDAEEVFSLEKAGQRRAAIEFMERELDQTGFFAFEELTTQAVASDVKFREVLLAQLEKTLHTAQAIPLIAAFCTLSLILLLRAYLSADLFTPLQRLEQAMRDASRGDFRQRLAEDSRADELGAINRAFDQLLKTIAAREQMVETSMTGEFKVQSLLDGQALKTTPSRLLLHKLVSRIRARLLQFKKSATQGIDHGTSEDQHLEGVLEQLNILSQVLTRITEFGFPLDLNLASTDVVTLLHDVLMRFQDELARRSVSFEITIAPEVGEVVVDRLKLREVLSALVRNGLSSLPERGGKLGIRASIEIAEDKELLIEIANQGRGHDPHPVNQEITLSPVRSGREQRTGVGLTLAKAIIEQHGGRLQIKSMIGAGSYVKIAIPLRE